MNPTYFLFFVVFLDFHLRRRDGSGVHDDRYEPVVCPSSKEKKKSKEAPKKRKERKKKGAQPLRSSLRIILLAQNPE